MAKEFLRTVGAGIGVVALAAAASSVGAQENSTVGNPQLKDFELPGTRTTPPPADTQPQPQAAPPTQTPSQAPPPAIVIPPPEAPIVGTPRRTSPEPRAANRRSAPVAAAARQPAPAPAIVAPPGSAPSSPSQAPAAIPTLADPAPALPAPPAAAQPSRVPAPTVASAEPQRGLPWLGIGIAALLALLGLGGLIAWKRSRGAAEAEPSLDQPTAPVGEPPQDPLFARQAAKGRGSEAATGAAATASAAPAPQPRPAPRSAIDGSDTVSIALRPRLELEFRPDRAAATATEASVQFELLIRNVGNRTARDIRIQIHMDNAGPDQDRELDAFFAQPVPAEIAPAVAAIAPGADAKIQTSITLPKERVRELSVQGRQLFVPVVAFNVFYQWENGRTGQTSMSYVVGQEAATPKEKLGPFRLDVGPRLYRSVGQRRGSLAKVV